MPAVPTENALMLAGILFALGVVGVLVRRNVIFVLMSIEVMLNASGLAFVAAGARWGRADGQIMFLFVLAAAAAEVAIGLALVIQLYYRFRLLDTDSINEMHG